MARARLDAVHGKDVTGLIGLVCNSVFHVPILSKNGPSYEEPLLWPEPGSNWRPHTFQACALPTELSGQKPQGTSATLTGLEPATSAVTGRRANQLRHRAIFNYLLCAGHE